MEYSLNIESKLNLKLSSIMEWIKAKISFLQENKKSVGIACGVAIGFSFLYFLNRRYRATNYWNQERIKELTNNIKAKYDGNKDIKFVDCDIEKIEDNGMSFCLFIAKKTPVVNKNYENNFGKKITHKNDPFEPPLKESLVVTHDLNSKHRIVYNKYCLINYHLLLISKEFETQDTPLDYYDVEAMLIVKLAVKNSIIFFNCGSEGGASQPHKHMQCFSEDDLHYLEDPLDKDKKEGILPTTIFEKYFKSRRDTFNELTALSCPALPFKHEIRYFRKPLTKLLNDENIPKSDVVNLVFNCYREMLSNIGETKFFNFIMTDDYMFMIPRKCGSCEGYHINSITLMGIQYLKSKDLVRGFKDIGPYKAICSVTISE